MDVEGQSKGRFTVIKEKYGDALAISFKGRDHLPKGNTVGSSRDYDLLIQRVFAKASLFSRDMTVLFSERQPKWAYPRGAYVQVIQFGSFIFVIKFASILFSVFPYKPSY